MGNAIDFISQLIESYFGEAWKTGKSNLIESATTPNCLTYSPMPIPEGSNSGAIELRERFPELKYEIKDLVITADKVIANVVMTGTQLTEFCRLQPTLNRS